MRVLYFPSPPTIDFPTNPPDFPPGGFQHLLKQDNRKDDQHDNSRHAQADDTRGMGPLKAAPTLRNGVNSHCTSWQATYGLSSVT